MRLGGDVPFAHNIHVPLQEDVQPARPALVRRLDDVDSIFRTVQGAQGRPLRQHSHTAHRREPRAGTPRMLDCVQRRALFPQPVPDKHPQAQHTRRHVRTRPGLCRKRPRELHRRARRRIRLLHARPGKRRHRNAHGGSCHRRLCKHGAAPGGRNDHDHHAVDIAARAVGQPDRAVALDHLRMLHGVDGLVAGRQGMGTRERRL